MHNLKSNQSILLLLFGDLDRLLVESGGYEILFSNSESKFEAVWVNFDGDKLEADSLDKAGQATTPPSERLRSRTESEPDFWLWFRASKLMIS